MRKTLGLFIALSFAFFGSANESRAAACADGIKVNNIWCKFILNYNNSGSNVCVAENYNNQSLTVLFDIYPAPGYITPIPKPYRHQTIPVVMPPNEFYTIFGWTPGQAPNGVENCSLIGRELSGGKRMKINAKDVRKSDGLL
jgi:hypothetical protein